MSKPLIMQLPTVQMATVILARLASYVSIERLSLPEFLNVMPGQCQNVAGP